MRKTPAGNTSQTEHLKDLVPAKVGRQAARAFAERAAELAPPLASGVTVSVFGATEPERLDDSAIAKTFAALTRYAQHGAPVEGLQDDKEAAEAVLRAAADALGSPVRRWNPKSPAARAALVEAIALKRDDAPPTLLLVLACAWTRVQIARGDVVPLASLARLASISAQRAHQVADGGKIKVQVVRASRGGLHSTAVSAGAARKFLASRADSTVGSTSPTEGSTEGSTESAGELAAVAGPGDGI